MVLRTLGMRAGEDDVLPGHVQREIDHLAQIEHQVEHTLELELVVDHLFEFLEVGKRELAVHIDLHPLRNITMVGIYELFSSNMLI